MTDVSEIAMLVLMFVVATAALGLGAWAAPRWMPATTPLGVRVPSDRTADPVVRAAVSTYRRTELRLTAVVVGVMLVGSLLIVAAGPAWAQQAIGALLAAGMLAMFAAVYVSFYRCSLPIRQAKAEQGWYDGKRVGIVASVTPERSRVRVPWGWYVAALVILAATAAYGAATYDSMPAMLVTHSSGSGPDQWAPKSFWTAFWPLLAGVGMVVFLGLIAWGISRRPVQIEPAGDLALARARAVRKAALVQRMVGLCALDVSLIFAVLSFGIWTEASWTTPAILVLAVATSPVIVAMTVRNSTATSAASTMRPGTFRTDGGAVAETPDDDRFWKWGMVYVNPSDPRFMVEKRMGLGYTVNVGHPAGKAFIAVPLLLAGCALVVALVVG